MNLLYKNVTLFDLIMCITYLHRGDSYWIFKLQTQNTSSPWDSISCTISWELSIEPHSADEPHQFRDLCASTQACPLKPAHGWHISGYHLPSTCNVQSPSRHAACAPNAGVYKTCTVISAFPERTTRQCPCVAFRTEHHWQQSGAQWWMLWLPESFLDLI